MDDLSLDLDMDGLDDLSDVEDVKPTKLPATPPEEQLPSMNLDDLSLGEDHLLEPSELQTDEQQGRTSNVDVGAMEQTEKILTYGELQTQENSQGSIAKINIEDHTINEPSAPPKVCGVCEDCAAVVYCSECELFLCAANGCDADMHETENHIRQPVSTAGNPAEEHETEVVLDKFATEVKKEKADPDPSSLSDKQLNAVVKMQARVRGSIIRVRAREEKEADEKLQRAQDMLDRMKKEDEDRAAGVFPETLVLSDSNQSEEENELPNLSSFNQQDIHTVVKLQARARGSIIRLRLTEEKAAEARLLRAHALLDNEKQQQDVAKEEKELEAEASATPTPDNAVQEEPSSVHIGGTAAEEESNVMEPNPEEISHNSCEEEVQQKQATTERIVTEAQNFSKVEDSTGEEVATVSAIDTLELSGAEDLLSDIDGENIAHSSAFEQTQAHTTEDRLAKTEDDVVAEVVAASAVLPVIHASLSSADDTNVSHLDSTEGPPKPVVDGSCRAEVVEQQVDKTVADRPFAQSEDGLDLSENHNPSTQSLTDLSESDHIEDNTKLANINEVAPLLCCVCAGASAIWRCANCNMLTCTDCDKHVHATAEKQLHERFLTEHPSADVETLHQSCQNSRQPVAANTFFETDLKEMKEKGLEGSLDVDRVPLSHGPRERRKAAVVSESSRLSEVHRREAPVVERDTSLVFPYQVGLELEEANRERDKLAARCRQLEEAAAVANRRADEECAKREQMEQHLLRKLGEVRSEASATQSELSKTRRLLQEALLQQETKLEGGDHLEFCSDLLHHKEVTKHKKINRELKNMLHQQSEELLEEAKQNKRATADGSNQKLLEQVRHHKKLSFLLEIKHKKLVSGFKQVVLSKFVQNLQTKSLMRTLYEKTFSLLQVLLQYGSKKTIPQLKQMMSEMQHKSRQVWGIPLVFSSMKMMVHTLLDSHRIFVHVFESLVGQNGMFSKALRNPSKAVGFNLNHDAVPPPFPVEYHVPPPGFSVPPPSGASVSVQRYVAPPRRPASTGFAVPAPQSSVPGWSPAFSPIAPPPQTPSPDTTSGLSPHLSTPHVNPLLELQQFNSKSMSLLESLGDTCEMKTSNSYENMFIPAPPSKTSRSRSGTGRLGKGINIRSCTEKVWKAYAGALKETKPAPPAHPNAIKKTGWQGHAYGRSRGSNLNPTDQIDHINRINQVSGGARIVSGGWATHGVQTERMSRRRKRLAAYEHSREEPYNYQIK